MQLVTRIFCWCFMLAFPLLVFSQPPANSVNGKPFTKKRVEKKSTEEDEVDSFDELDMDIDSGDDDLNLLEMEEDDDADLGSLDDDDDDATIASLETLELESTSSLSALDVLSTGETVTDRLEEEEEYSVVANVAPTKEETLLPEKTLVETNTSNVQDTIQKEPEMPTVTSPAIVGTPPPSNVAANSSPDNVDYEEDEKDWSPVFLPISSENLSNVTLKEVRPLSEVNKENISEAYPWISADGLRLFFTQNDDDRDHLYWMEREDVSMKFSNKQEVAIQSGQKGGKFSCWLTNSELEIYYIIRTEDPRGSLFHATRSSWDEPFSNERQVMLDGQFDGFLSSPSLSPDGEYLYLYNGGEKRKIVTFRKVGEDSFVFENELPTPFELGPSQINKEGTHFLIGMGRKFTHDCSLYWVENNGNRFDKVTYLQLQSDQMRLRMDQPTLSADGRTLVFVNGLADFWTNNDLYIVTLPNDLNSIVSKGQEEIKTTLYLSEPDANPISDYANVSYFLPVDSDKKAEIVILNEKAQEVNRLTLSASAYNATLDFSELPNGEYEYQLLYNGEVASKHKVKVRR
ncbi:MAG: hypothetical protein ACKVTZ_14390 [Bacteroidia bacterium]